MPGPLALTFNQLACVHFVTSLIKGKLTFSDARCFIFTADKYVIHK
jgi:hypothetical protein